MPERVKRLEPHYLLRLRVGAYDFGDFKDFGCAAPPDIRNYVVFDVPVVQQNRFRGSLVEVYDGSAAQPEGPRGDPQFQHLLPVAAFERRDQYYNIGGLSEASRTDAVETGQIEEEELLREAEVLLQQAVAHKGSPGIRQNPLVLRKTHRLQRVRGQDHGLHLRLGRGIADDDLHAVIAQQLIERMDQMAFPVDIKAQGRERQFGKRQVSRAAQTQAQSRHRLRRADGRLQTVGRAPIGFAHSHRPEGDVVAGAELAG